MASGGARYDFTTEENFTQGEDRTVRFPVKDADGNAVSSFAGWEFTWYLYTQLKDTTALITKTSLAGGITASAPNADVLLDPVDTSGFAAKTYWYELWRTDTDDKIRLAWGQFPIVN